MPEQAEHVILVTGVELTTDTHMAFLVKETTRERAKRAVYRYCEERGWDMTAFLHTHILDFDIIRIDPLIQR